MNRAQLARLLGVVGTVVCIGIYVREPSFPTPDKIVIFLTCIFLIFGQARELLRRFLPFVILLLAYESFRGVIPSLNQRVNYMWMPGVDIWFGHGELPTVILQRWWWPGYVQWYDFMFYIAYMMHFVLPFALAIYVWKRMDMHYWRYVAAFITVSFAGFLTFLAFPAAPPWLASDKNLIPTINRVSSDVWFALGVHDFPSVYNKISPNPVAAVPSLHAAYATLFAIFIFEFFRRSKWKYASIIYPALIYVGTVYMGEHYLIDELLGGLYALATYLAAPYIVRAVTSTWHTCKTAFNRRIAKDI